jgi:nitroreductase
MEIKDVLDIFEGRESIRVYDLEKPLEQEKLETILKAGILSPSSVGFEPWKFIVVQDREILESLKDLGFGIKTQFETASAVVFICAMKDANFANPTILNHLLTVKGYPEKIIPKLEENYTAFFRNDLKIEGNEKAMFDWACKQTYIALGNMMTAAQMLGVQSCPVEGFNYDKMNELLIEKGILDDPDYALSVIMSLGYEAPAKKRPKTRRTFDSVVKLIK